MEVSCEGCGVCCQGFFAQITEWDLKIFKDVAQNPTYEVFNPDALDNAQLAGFHYYKVPNTGFRIDAYMIGNCKAFDPTTKRCRIYESRPKVCADFKVGDPDCLIMRQKRLPSQTLRQKIITWLTR